MKTSFVETMRGTLKDPSGRVTPVDFQVRTEGTRARGVVHAPPWTIEAPCEGTLVISAMPPSITYELAFVADDGRQLVLAGHKSPSVLRPIHSMTVLPLSLRERGEGRGEGPDLLGVTREAEPHDRTSPANLLLAMAPHPTSPRFAGRGVSPLASGEVRFDLLDLPGFLASWLPLPTTARRRFEARHTAVTRRALLGD